MKTGVKKNKERKKKRRNKEENKDKSIEERSIGPKYTEDYRRKANEQ